MKNTDYLIDPDEVANLIHHNVESGFSHTTYREELETRCAITNTSSSLIPVLRREW